MLENLTGIRSRVTPQAGKQARRLHSWSFAQLAQFTRYKARGQGQQVVLVDPRHTRQTCSRCGHTAQANGPKQAVFCCQACYFQLNADLNAARNIAAKYLLAREGTAPPGGLPVNQPIVSSPIGDRDASPSL